MPENGEDRVVRARSFWSGTLSFGLVTIPVRLFPATRSSRVSLRMLGEDGTPLERRYYCPAHEPWKELDRDEIVRGYETDEGFVVVTDEELERLEPEKTRNIELDRFVPREALDPVFFQRGYFLTPASEATKAYRLLARTMERTGRAGIATFVMRSTEYLVAILSDGGILRAETLRFQDEIRTPGDVGLPAPRDPGDDRVEAVAGAIRSHEAEELSEEELEDHHAERLLELVERKRAAGEDVARPAGAAPEEASEDVEVIDLMEVLKRSLRGGGSGEEEGARPRPARGGGALEELTKAQLYERARAMDIPGRSGMNKKELVEAVGEAEKARKAS